MDLNIVCYKCNNLGHKACNCRDMKEDGPIIKKEKLATMWEKKDNSSKEDCRLALIVEDKEDEWYIESGCSTHMVGDQKKNNEFKERKKW
jgi:beta-xylosidase